MQNYFCTQLLWVTKSLWVTFKKIPLVMRLLVIFIISSIGLVQATNSYAQKATVSLDVRNQTVKEVLDEIEDQSDFTFFFNNRHLDL